MRSKIINDIDIIHNKVEEDINNNVNNNDKNVNHKVVESIFSLSNQQFFNLFFSIKLKARKLKQIS